MPSFRAQSRNPPCTLFFLAPFAEGFQFYFVTHTTLYRCARKSEDFARDDVAEMAFSKHIRCTLREINPFPPYRHFEHSEKSSLHSVFPCPFRGRLPILLCHTYDAISVCKKDRGLHSGWRYRNSAFQTYPLYATWNKPIPHTVISSAARNLPRTPLFLAPFADGFPFSAITHTTLSPPARKIPRLRSGWRCVNGVFQTYPLYATWNKPIPPIPSFRAQREIFLALCSFLLLSQKFSPFPLSHIRRYIGVQERSLGFARDDDTGIALSQHILYTMRRISPYDAKEKSPGKSRSFFVSERLICQTVRAWCLLLLQYQ